VPGRLDDHQLIQFNLFSHGIPPLKITTEDFEFKKRKIKSKNFHHRGHRDHREELFKRLKELELKITYQFRVLKKCCDRLSWGPRALKALGLSDILSSRN
jgi:hypothetical protein